MKREIFFWHWIILVIEEIEISLKIYQMKNNNVAESLPPHNHQRFLMTSLGCLAPGWETMANIWNIIFVIGDVVGTFIADILQAKQVIRFIPIERRQ